MTNDTKTPARVIEGYVDQFVEPEGFDANDGELIYFQKTKQLSMDLPATLIIGDQGIPKTQVLEMLRDLKDQTMSQAVEVSIDRIAAKYGLDL